MAVLHYNFHSHPKIVGLSKASIGVYALALSYASGNLTDGFVPDSYVRSLDPNHQSLTKRSPFARLIEAGLVAKVEGGYAIHDYLDYNPSKAEVEEKRRLARERMARVRTNTGAKKQKRSREQQEPVTPNVRDIGKDKPSLEPKSGPPSTVQKDVAVAPLGDLVEDNVVELDSHRREPQPREHGESGLRPIGDGVQDVMTQLFRARGQSP